MNPAPTSVELAAWLGCLAFFVGFINQLAKAKQNLFGEKARPTEISPQPLDVRMAAELVRKEDCINRHSEAFSRIQEVRHEVERIREERAQDTLIQSESRKALYERIERTERELLSKMDVISDQVVTRLLNSKQLWKQ
jgi:hypothetical protein